MEATKNMHIKILGGFKWRDLCCAAFLVGLTTAAFLPVLSARFLSWDDNTYLFENPIILSKEPSSWADIFVTPICKIYTPLTALSFKIEYLWFGLNPFFYHLNNLLLHMGVVLMIYILVQRMGFAVITAFLSALFFAVHPMHVESVAWVSQRKDVLYSFFYLLSLYHYWNYLTSSSKSAYYISLVFGSLSILAKPMALSLPFILLLLHWYRQGRVTRLAVLNVLPFMLVIFPIAWASYQLNDRAPFTGFQESFLIWLWTATFYIKKFFMPFVLLPLYKLPQPVSLGNPAYSSAFFILVAVISSMVALRKNRLFLFGVIFYIFSTFFLWRYDERIYITIVGDRFMYLPSLGLCLWLAQTLVNQLRVKRFSILIFAASILLLCGVKTFYQSRIWQDDLTLWNYVIDHGQKSALAYNSRAVALSKRGENEKALRDLDEAISLNSNYAKAYYNRGKVHYNLGSPENAILDFNQSLVLNANHEQSYLDRGVVYNQIGKPQLALVDFEKALALNSKDARAYNNLGTTYKKLGRLDLAMSSYDRALEFNPNLTETYINRSSLWEIMKDYDKAILDLRKAKNLGAHIDLKRLEGLQILASHENP